MSTVTDLVTSIKSRMATVLGATYSELSNVTEIEKNAFKGADKRYGVMANQADEVEGTVCHLTVDQAFEITLTDGYFSNIKASDADKRAKTLALQDKISEVYRDIKTNKAGRPDLVIHTFGLSIAEPEFLEENHVVVVNATFTIKYRYLL